jgi:NAD(P) transhydrogenase
VVVDQRPQVGGNCTHKGTIPSRALREAVKQMIDFNTNPMFKDIARAQITNESVGMLKILFHPDTLEILGVHCFGDQASEIVHIGQAIMNQPGASNSLAFFANTTFNYPTMAEAYRVAAINGLNRVS